jgi:hypothetical protein
MSENGCISAIIRERSQRISIRPIISKLAAQWSGRRESNPRNQFGKLMFYH